jgi:chromosome segregation ATPase
MFGNKKGITMKNLILKWLGLGKNINDVYTKLEQRFDMTNERIDTLQEHKKYLYKEVDEHNIDIATHNRLIRDMSESLDNRRNEINGIIETLQNLDNHEVVSDLHKRIQNLEKKYDGIKIYEV